MRLTATVFLAFVATTLTAADKAAPKPKDLCVPPPSGVAPSLPAKLLDGQGRVHFPITTVDPRAQEFFDQGVAQLHSFWAREAERSFLQAAQLDPAAPMPWWGVAMVAAGDYRPRFQIDTLTRAYGKAPKGAAARAIEASEKAQRLAQVPGKASELEKMYIAAVAARRSATLKDPDQGYIDALRAIVATHPGEVEAKSYLALHLMRGFTLPDKRPIGTSMEAARLLRELLAEAPDHPAVHHYVIHGFEGSTFAEDAWPSCRRYAELTRNIPHALHMPGHIWSQTGKWKEAIESFESAAANELGWIRADSLYGTGHHGHNVHYLALVYAFDGNFPKALETAQSLLAFKENPREAAALDSVYSAYRQGWLATMRVLVFGEQWDLLLDGHTLPLLDKPRFQAWRHWAAGMAQAGKGNAQQASLERKALDAAIADLRRRTKLPEPPELRVARKELDGHIQMLAGKTEAGLKTLETAARAERHLVYAEPPFYPRPVYEALGQAALKRGRREIAERAFRQALEQYPESHGARTGLAALRNSASGVPAGL